MRIVLFIFSLFLAFNCFAQKSDTLSLSLNFPVVDLPYQQVASETYGGFIKGYDSPSMNQSLHLSTNFYSAINYGVKKAVKIENKKLNFALRNVIAGGLDYVVNTLPLGVAWQHEEFHRAVLTKNNIKSYNEVYDLNLFAPAIFVSHVTDEDLIRLNDTKRLEFVRLNSAGIESTNAQLQLMQKNNFFNSSDLPNIIYYWVSTLGNISYIKSTISEEANEGIDTETRAESTDISKRDFTGPDFSAWAYALFNPDELYEARGAHPSGVGIYRSIRPNQLSDEATAFLTKQGNLNYLNLVSPLMFGFKGFKFGKNKSTYGNFALRHGLTPFGNDISLDAFIKNSNANLFFTLHRYKNYNSASYGIDAAIINKQIFNDNLLVSGGANLWFQPENLDFFTGDKKLGGAINLKLALTKFGVKPYVELLSKTQGWLQANEYLEGNTAIRFGANFDVLN